MSEAKTVFIIYSLKHAQYTPPALKEGPSSLSALQTKDREQQDWSGKREKRKKEGAARMGDWDYSMQCGNGLSHAARAMYGHALHVVLLPQASAREQHQPTMASGGCSRFDLAVVKFEALSDVHFRSFGREVPGHVLRPRDGGCRAGPQDGADGAESYSTPGASATLENPEHAVELMTAGSGSWAKLCLTTR
ncbi:hypothetical protein G7046_g4353 [Stylonectria norvegica]|nr:hypothetical protein G7046_g4353 [Stylonectria norvegica]